MKLPTLKFIFDRKKCADDYKSATRKKKGLLQLEVYYARQRRWISTGIKLYSGQWHENKWVVNHPDSASLNSQLKTLLKVTNENIARQLEESEDISFETLCDAISSEQEGESLSDIIEQKVEDLRLRGKAYNTYSVFKALKTHVEAYRKMRRISDLTYSNISSFNKFLKNDRGLGDTTVNLYHTKLKQICHELVISDKLKKSPYDKFQFESLSASSKIKYLTEDEIKKIREYDFKKENEAYARDFFIFQTMTGMAYCDVMALDANRDIVEMEGKNVLVNFRIKTEVRFSIVIMEPAMDILRRHGGVLNRYCAQNLTVLLKSVGEQAIGRKITSHMGRHSFSVIALRHGIPIEYVSKMLGHTNIQTTQRYAKLLPVDVLSQFDKLKEVF